MSRSANNFCKSQRRCKTQMQERRRGKLGQPVERLASAQHVRLITTDGCY